VAVQVVLVKAFLNLPQVVVVVEVVDQMQVQVVQAVQAVH
jgi:hypothetical protein